MIKTDEVIEFFNKYADSWDDYQVTDDEKIHKILDNAGIQAGMNLLDVACGTGVMFPYYIEREVGSITGIDISPKMIECAKAKFNSTDTTKINLICKNVEEIGHGKNYDAIVIYNAFPHFPDTERLIGHLSKLLKKDGILTVAHGASREEINAHHAGSAAHVSNGLMEIDDLSDLFSRYLDVKFAISNNEYYQIVGINK